MVRAPPVAIACGGRGAPDRAEILLVSRERLRSDGVCQSASAMRMFRKAEAESAGTYCCYDLIFSFQMVSYSNFLGELKYFNFVATSGRRSDP